MRIKIQSPYKIVCLLLFALLVIWLGSRFVEKDSAPEASRYLYLMKTSADDASYQDIYRFEEGGEVPIRLSLEGVQGVVEGFCATEGKLYLCCREGDRYYLEECDADGRFLRLVADSRQVPELESVFWPTMYAEGEHLYFLYDTSYDVSYRQALEALPRTEESAIYNGRWEYICLDIETGTASRRGFGRRRASLIPVLFCMRINHPAR